MDPNGGGSEAVTPIVTPDLRGCTEPTTMPVQDVAVMSDATSWRLAWWAEMDTLIAELNCKIAEARDCLRNIGDVTGRITTAAKGGRA